MNAKAPMTQGGHTHGVHGAPLHIPVWPPMEHFYEHGGPHHAAGSLMTYADPPEHAAIPLLPQFEAYAQRCGPMSPIRPGGR